MGVVVKITLINTHNAVIMMPRTWGVLYKIVPSLLLYYVLCFADKGRKAGRQFLNLLKNSHKYTAAKGQSQVPTRVFRFQNQGLLSLMLSNRSFCNDEHGLELF